MGCGSLKPQRRPPHAHAQQAEPLGRKEGRSPYKGNVHETTVGGVKMPCYPPTPSSHVTCRIAKPMFDYGKREYTQEQGLQTLPVLHFAYDTEDNLLPKENLCKIEPAIAACRLTHLIGQDANTTTCRKTQHHNRRTKCTTGTRQCGPGSPRLASISVFGGWPDGPH